MNGGVSRQGATISTSAILTTGPYVSNNAQTFHTIIASKASFIKTVTDQLIILSDSEIKNNYQRVS